MSPIITQDIPLQGMHINKLTSKFCGTFEYNLFVRCGAEIWTVYGENGKSEYQCCGTVFRLQETPKYCFNLVTCGIDRFQESAKGGRSCFSEGQIPGILFSPVY